MTNTIEAIRKATPSYSTINSQRYFFEILEQDWRIYSAKHQPLIDKLIARFLKSHATVPGFSNASDSLAPWPISVLYWETDEGSEIKIGVYKNGAVLLKDSKEHALLVDEETASLWNYPDGYKKLSEEFDALS